MTDAFLRPPLLENRMNWKNGLIDGCVVRPLRKFEDERGWLTEFFRSDDLHGLRMPAMGYVSMTRPGVTRGPHEHREQTDCFVFYSSTFRVFLWDARADSGTFGNRQTLLAGADHPLIIVIPPGVVHAYRNEGDSEGLIINVPDALYAGAGRKEPVDEIRYEDLEHSPYRLDV